MRSYIKIANRFKSNSHEERKKTFNQKWKKVIESLEKNKCGQEV